MTAKGPSTTFPVRAVAALFLERQHLVRPRRRRLTKTSLGRFAADTGGVQIDSINAEPYVTNPLHPSPHVPT